MGKSIKHICCVDSIDEGTVRLLTGTDGDRAHFFPLALFPKGIKEGDWLNLTISIDSNATKRGKQDVEDLYKELQ
ncbi:MAG: DUF3006 domain-containing protein [Synergistaceae bacterium]|nr:DUF3006 domain-containing protein [Synergistaceae bacterium]